jgi:hypothetical protein
MNGCRRAPLTQSRAETIDARAPSPVGDPASTAGSLVEVRSWGLEET